MTNEDPTGSRKPTNAKDRVATNRLDMSLFPETAAALGALALAEGDLKYGAGNYRVEGVLASVYVAALRRHLAKWWDGQEDDPITCVPELASVLACVAILVDSQACGKLRDDRPPKGGVAGILASAELNMAELRKLFPNPPPRFTAARVQVEAERAEDAAVMERVYDRSYPDMTDLPEQPVAEARRLAK